MPMACSIGSSYSHGEDDIRSSQHAASLTCGAGLMDSDTHDERMGYFEESTWHESLDCMWVFLVQHSADC